jgi:hypothetical protein
MSLLRLRDLKVKSEAGPDRRSVRGERQKFKDKKFSELSKDEKDQLLELVASTLGLLKK